ncbi:MAG: DUF1501 domain-containing protein [Gemmatales bacterium]|nr:DUF1501 domain-containing protein [Gemmatales bacterium]MDW8222507.1 DUF1501 domain-containing protein [Gemmatales bacterium]
MDPIREYALTMTRRHFFGKTGVSLGALVLATLMPEKFVAQESRGGNGVPGLPHFRPRAKRAIFLFMNGGPSQMDLWDYKPKMREWFDKDLPPSVRGNQRLTTMTSGQARFPIAPSKFSFERHGKSGIWVSELLPYTAKVVDELCIIKSMHTEAINHDPAVTYICTGSQIPGRPSLGAWLSYGLGSLNQNLPTFIVMTPTSTYYDAQALYQRLWGSGVLPSKHAGVALRAIGDPILYLSNPSGMDSEIRRHMLDAVAQLNQKKQQELGDPEIMDRIAQYEMAFRMQASVPELMDLSKEPEHVLQMYGPQVRKPGTVAASCLLARRLIERGVRFVQIFHRGWDHHGSLPQNIKTACMDSDQPIAALITDLKQRGLLEDTLVIWGGEFGRTIYCQGKLTPDNYGRDHHPRCFTYWLAGAGVKRGFVYGETDDFSYNIIRDPVHIHNLNATILHLFGIDHRRLTVKFQGLDLRLTGTEDHEPVLELLS